MWITFMAGTLRERLSVPPDNDPRTNPTGHGTWVAGFGGATPTITKA